MFVCLCRAVTDHEILEAVDNGISDVGELAEACGVATGCGSCLESAQELIDRRLAEAQSYAA